MNKKKFKANHTLHYFVFSLIILVIFFISSFMGSRLLDGGTLVALTITALNSLLCASILYRAMFFGESKYKIYCLYSVGFAVILLGVVFLFFVFNEFDTVLSETMKEFGIEEMDGSIAAISSNFKLVSSVFISAVFGGVGASMMVIAMTYKDRD